MAGKKVKILTLRFNENLGCFDDSELQRFNAENEIAGVSDHFFSHGDKHYMAMRLTYNERAGGGKKEDSKGTMPAEDPAADLNEKEKRVYESLRQWRFAEAQRLNIPVYQIAHNKHLVQLAKMRPRTKDDLTKAAGLGQQKVIQYGDEILRVLSENDPGS